MYQNETATLNENNGLAQGILSSFEAYVSSFLTPTVTTELLSKLNTLFFWSNVSDDELELFTNANFWKAYKQIKAGKIKRWNNIAEYKRALRL